MLKNIEEYSGNIKLRLPRTLHAMLNYEAQLEGVSLNQLCLMHLSRGVSLNYLGTEEFNYRLRSIARECVDDEEKLFVYLDMLNKEIEALKPLLLQELQLAIDDNKKNMVDYVEILRSFFPIYPGDIIGQEMPMLKVPSAKVVLKPTKNKRLNFSEIKDAVMSVCKQAHVDYGDYDFYDSMGMSTKEQVRIKSISIYICCDYSVLKNNIKKIKAKLQELNYCKDVDIIIKPCYLQESTRRLLERNNMCF